MLNRSRVRMGALLALAVVVTGCSARTAATGSQGYTPQPAPRFTHLPEAPAPAPVVAEPLPAAPPATPVPPPVQVPAPLPPRSAELRPPARPEVPPRRYVCFYPMSKRRGEQVNWFDLPEAERATLMKGHGEIGRRWAGRVVQVISGSVGLDDWEWGVTLFADDPLVFKKLIYEMRFDPASSRYALFGPFYVGIRFAPSALGQVLHDGI